MGFDYTTCPPDESIADCAWFYYTFHYRPNVQIAWLHCYLFVGITVIAAAQTLRFRGLRYMWILPFTGVLELLGYWLKADAAITKDTFGRFVPSVLFLLMSPIFLALINYTVIGRLLRASGQRIGCLSPRWVTRMFLLSDVLTFFVQGGGGGMLAIQSDAAQAAGQAIVLVGLAIQIAFFTAFVCTIHAVGTQPRFGVVQLPSLRPVLHCLYVTIGLLFIRNIYRLVEFASGIESPVVTNEWVRCCQQHVALLSACKCSSGKPRM